MLLREAAKSTTIQLPPPGSPSQEDHMPKGNRALSGHTLFHLYDAQIEIETLWKGSYLMGIVEFIFPKAKPSSPSYPTGTQNEEHFHLVS